MKTMHKMVMGLAVFSAAGLVHADAARPYVGVTYGINTEVDADKLAANCGTGGVTCSDLGNTDDAWQFYGGYPIRPNIALEGGYTNLVYVAKAKDSGGRQAEQKTDGIALNLVGRKALSGKTNVYGKVGAYLWNSETKSTVGNAEDSGTSPTVGLGLEYGINDKWTVRGGWDRFFSVGKDDALITGGAASTLKEDIDTLSIGLNYNF